MSQAAIQEVIAEVPGFTFYGPEVTIPEPQRLTGEAGLTRRNGIMIAVAGVVGVALTATLVAPNLFGASNANESADLGTTPTTEGETATTLEPAEEATELCPATWELEAINHGDRNRVLDSGIASAGLADTNDEARRVFLRWVDIIKKDPDMLDGNASAILDRNVNRDALVSDDGTCATPYAERIVAETEALVLLQGEVTPADPTADLTNTGTDANGELVASSEAGLSGNLSGITITLEDGRKFGILRRCGNLVMEGNPDLPDGPTDEPNEPGEPPEEQEPPKHDDGDIPGPGGVTPTTQPRPTGPVVNNPGNFNPTTSTTQVVTPTQPTVRPPASTTTTTAAPPPPPPPQG